MREKLFIWLSLSRSLRRAGGRLSERLENLLMAIEKLPRSLIMLRSLKQANLVLSGTCSLKRAVVAYAS